MHPDKIGQEKADVLRRLRETGVGETIFMRQGAEVLGRPIAKGTAGRHLKHYRTADELAGHEMPADPAVKVGNLEILERIIQRGFANSHTWKPSIKDTLDAMRLYVQITGNTGEDDLLKLFDVAEDELAGAVENPAALAGADERAEALPEPLL